MTCGYFWYKLNSSPLTTNPCSELKAELALPPITKHSMIGRNREMDAILDAVASDAPARVVILGPPGIGKTTLAAAVLHHSQIKAKYPVHRYFIPCDGINSIDLLLLTIAKTLNIPTQVQDQDLHSAIFTALQSNATLICLDNFETPWEHDKVATEVLLKQLANLSNLVILATMRGIQQPAAAHIQWTNPILWPLDPGDAATLFKQISGKEDSYTAKLSHAVGYLPLAVELLATLTLEYDDTATVWGLWEHRRTAIIENGGEGRLDNLDISIQLSIDSPRMKRNSEAIQILTLLAVLPDGLNQDNSMVERLQSYIHGTNIHSALQTLRRTALAFDRNTIEISNSRVHLHPTIRHFASTNIVLTAEVWTGFEQFYLDLLEEGHDFTQGTSHSLVYPELVNLQSVIKASLSKPEQHHSPELFQACTYYTFWLLYTGSHDDTVISLAIKSHPPSIILKGNCWQCAGEVEMARDQLDKAEEAFKAAQTFHQMASDVLGEGYDLLSLGKLYLRRDQLEEAEEVLKAAQTLHQKGNSVHGEAYDLLNLGMVYMRKDQLEEAEKAFKAAQIFHQKDNSAQGEAYVLLNLGWLYIRRDQLEEAEEALKVAQTFHQKTDDAQGEANDLLNLAELYIRRDQLEEAEEALKTAQILHQKASHALGEGDDLLNLGELYMRRDRLGDAEGALKAAHTFHQKAHYVLGEGDDLLNLGRLYMRREQLGEAEEAFKDALTFYQQAKSALGQGNTLQKLGELYMRRGKWEEASVALQKACTLHRQAQDTLGEANDFLLRKELSNILISRDP
jgi:tetratricopeptide (TPR) repeat protein